MSLSLPRDVSDYGGPVTVTKPDATSTLPSRADGRRLARLLAGASL